MRYSQVEYEELYHQCLSLAKMGDCLRRNYGCMIVRNTLLGIEEVSSGYTHIPKQMKPCTTCIREANGIPSGSCYEICRSIHAEQDALLCCRDTRILMNADLFILGLEADKSLMENPFVCNICKKMLMVSAINDVYLFYKPSPNIEYSVKREKVADYVL